MPKSKSNRRGGTNRLNWKQIAEDATVDCYGEYEQIGGWQAYLEDKIGLPCRCKVDRKESSLIGFDTTEYGSALLAIVKVEGNEFRVDATTVTVLEKEGFKYLEAFKKWL